MIKNVFPKLYLKIPLFMVFFFGFNILYSQGEAANWYFGSRMGANFSQNAVTPLANGQLDAKEGCASISNSKGELLFYTDGTKVWDKKHKIMPNGSGLKGDLSSTQSAIIVPKPNSNTIYYIFTVIDVGKAAGLSYSEVDLSLNNGDGDITSLKNIPLITPCAEKVTAVKHANGIDYWVATHRWNSSDFALFRVTENGVIATPIIQTIGNYHGGLVFNSIGYMKFSPNGTKIAIAKWSTDSFVEIFDFDSRTGILSNPISLNAIFGAEYENGAYGLEFSTNSKLLYISEIDLKNNRSKLHQFNLSSFVASDVINSKVVLFDENSLIAAIQLANDGKLYICRSLTSNLDVVEFPNTVGISCKYVKNGVSLKNNFMFFGLPSFLPSLFVGKIETSNFCSNNESQFFIKTEERIDNIVWDFGDGITSNLQNPTHAYELPKDYVVKATIQSGYNTHVITKVITVFETPTAGKPIDYVICDDVQNDGIETFNLSTKTSDILNGKSESDFKVAYFESYQDAIDHQNLLPLQYVNKQKSQKLYAKVTNRLNASCNDITSFNITVNSTPVIDMNEVWYLCPGERLPIYLNSKHDKYEWSNGGSGSQIIVDKSGVYTITVYNLNTDKQSMSCGATKTIQVLDVERPKSISVESKDWTASTNTISINVEGIGNYTYSIDGYTFQENNVFSNLESGDYEVYVKGDGGCILYSKEVSLLNYPKYFTPNDDGFNDYWKINFSKTEPDIEVVIYNRYGKLINKITSVDKGWDGTFNGLRLPTDDYWFVVNRPSKNLQHRGHFTLKR